MSAPMPNPFDPDSTVNSPRTVDQDVAHSPAAASDPAAIDSCQEPVAADLDHINEIFFYARKLIADGRRFVLDEAAFMASIDEEPLFLRQANG